MGVATAETLARAIELDDGLSLDVCPGCGKDITGWERWVFHLANDRDEMTYQMRWNRRTAVVVAPWPFVNNDNTSQRVRSGSPGEVCVWSRDFLVSRAFRRRLIETGDIP